MSPQVAEALVTLCDALEGGVIGREHVIAEAARTLREALDSEG